MEQAVEEGIFPAAELLVGSPQKIIFHHHYGQSREGTCFDISSLTKPISTATLAMHFVSEDLLATDDKLPKWFAAMLPDYQKMTVRHLLNHTSGLPAWHPYFRELPLDLVGTDQGRQFIIDGCLNEETVSQPGVQTIYSDIGYILLGAILEEVGLHTLDWLFHHRVAIPLKLKNTFFVRNIGVPLESATTPADHLHRRFAPTEDCPWRGRVIHGEVHDPNAYAMGGVAGHAGLFSTGADVHQFITTLVACHHGTSDWLPQETVRQFLDQKKNSFVLGWDTPAPKNSASGNHFSAHSIGHLGFSGCSMWIDLDQNFWIILLSNRIHPDATNNKIKSFRPKIHNLVWKELLQP